MLVILDPNVLISGALSPAGPPAELIRRWLDGEFELLVSPILLKELSRVLAYPKISMRIPSEDADALIDLIEAEAEIAPDPKGRPNIQVEDPDDEYLLNLALNRGAALVSGDRHLLVLAGRFPVYDPAAFVAELDRLHGGR